MKLYLDSFPGLMFLMLLLTITSPKSSFYLNHIPDLGIVYQPQGAEVNEKSLLFSRRSWPFRMSFDSYSFGPFLFYFFDPFYTFICQKTLELMVLGSERGLINRDR